jgi:hypothetical protein
VLRPLAHRSAHQQQQQKKNVRTAHRSAHQQQQQKKEMSEQNNKGMSELVLMNNNKTNNICS